MAIDLFNDTFSSRCISRRGATKCPQPYPFTAVMSVYYDVTNLNQYHAPLALGPNEAEGFVGFTYWSFSLFNTSGNPYSIGSDGNDTVTAVSGITGRWTKNAMIVRGVGQNLSWYWDLPDLNAVVHRNLANAITLTSGAELTVGSVPWTVNEGVDGGIAGVKMWQTVLPLWAILIEAQYEEPVLREFFPYLYSAPSTKAWNCSYTAPSLPTHVAAGAIASGVGTITPGLPAGVAVDDILVLFCESANEAVTISNQAGGTWTEAPDSPQGTGTAGSTGATRLTVFWSRYNGTQTAPTVADPGNHVIARMYAVRGCKTTGAHPFNATAGGVEATSDTSGSIPGATTTVPNCYVLAAITTDFDPGANGTAEFSAAANADLGSVTERIDNVRTDGNGGGLCLITGTKATPGAYGNTTVTHANAGVKAMWTGVLEPLPSATFTKIFTDPYGGRNFTPNPNYTAPTLRPDPPYFLLDDREDLLDEYELLGALEGGGADTTLAAVLSGTGSLAGALSTQITLAAAMTGSGSLAGALTTQIQLAAQLTGIGSLAAALLTEIRLAATLAGTGALVGNLSTDIRLAAALSGAASVAAALTTQITMAAQLAGTGTVAADLDAGGGTLNAALAGSGSLAGALTTDIRLAAALAGSAQLAAQFTTQITMAAQLAGSGSLAGALTTDIRFASALTASASLAAQLTTEIRLAVQLAGSAALAGALTTAIELRALLAGSGSLSAQLQEIITALNTVYAKLHVSQRVNRDLAIATSAHTDLRATPRVDRQGTL